MSGKARPGAPGVPRPDLGWQDAAACRGADPGLFFAPEVEWPDARERREAEAKRICASCPVRLPCLNWRLASGSQRDAGLWGGMNEDERILLRSRRVRAAAAARRRTAA